MIDIVATLNYLGITHDRVLPFLLLIGAMFYVSYKITYKFTDPLKKSISVLTCAVLEIQVILRNCGFALAHNIPEGSGSPLQPREYGRTLIIESGLQKILDERKSFLKTELLKLLPKNYTAYDVQEKARQLLLNLKDNEIMNPVKDYAYRLGIDADIILRTGGLWLRDDFLKQPRGLAKEEP
jgi:hypothetical protein